jgi:hypothetical protein
MTPVTLPFETIRRRDSADMVCASPAASSSASTSNCGRVMPKSSRSRPRTCCSISVEQLSRRSQIRRERLLRGSP